MDSDAYRSGSLVIPALARDGPATVENPTPAPAPAAVPPRPSGTCPPPAAIRPETLTPRSQEDVSALIGSLSLRAVRSQSSPR